MNDDVDLEPFTEALRADLPSQADEARVRLRLASAGILAGVGVAAPGAATAASGGAVGAASATGVVAKLALLPLAVKVTASLAVVGLAAAPFVVANRAGVAKSPEGGAMLSAARPTATAAVRAATPVASPNAPVAAVHEASAASERSTSLEPNAVATAPAAESRPGPARARVATLTASERVTQAALPSTGSFPVAVAETVDEGTLREETALVEGALAALKRGDLATARRDLATHAQKFPNGHLAPERERALARMREKETHR